ncbi:hypothetical protein DFH06DRAFT_1131349 [Mycena polygramma]|nr:hypothetical protein DFH06DRAFT_1131349 [Mycena polygramma]
MQMLWLPCPQKTRTGAVFSPQEPRQVSALTGNNFDFAPLLASAVACNQGPEDEHEEFKIPPPSSLALNGPLQHLNEAGARRLRRSVAAEFDCLKADVLRYFIAWEGELRGKPLLNLLAAEQERETLSVFADDERVKGAKGRVLDRVGGHPSLRRRLFPPNLRSASLWFCVELLWMQLDRVGPLLVALTESFSTPAPSVAALHPLPAHPLVSVNCDTVAWTKLTGYGLARRPIRPALACQMLGRIEYPGTYFSSAVPSSSAFYQQAANDPSGFRYRWFPQALCPVQVLRPQAISCPLAESMAATSFHVASQISAKSDILVLRLVPIIGPAKSLFPPHDEIIVEVSGAGLSHGRCHGYPLQDLVDLLPSIKGEGPCTFHLNGVDTLCADVDRTTSSWFFRKLTLQIRLSFPSPERLDGFLSTLSRIRISQAYCPISRAHCPVGWSSLHEVPVERHLSEVDFKEFYDIRAAAYTHARIHVLPAELLSEIFLFFRPLSAQYRPWEPPLLLLQICSAWRSAAIGTPLLWHNPSFTLDPS